MPRDPVRIESASDLIYWTYYMMKWDKVAQEDSDQKCSECGRLMKKVEPAEDAKSQKYDGYVCHDDKRLIWVKSS